MHSTDRLDSISVPSVHPETSRILSLFEELLIREDFVFLRYGNTVTLTSDFGRTIFVANVSGPLMGKVVFAMVPAMGLSAAQIQNIVAQAAATHEINLPFTVIEKPGYPVVITAEIEIQHLRSQNELSRTFSDFAVCTDVAIGDALRGVDRLPERKAGEFEAQIYRLRYSI